MAEEDKIFNGETAVIGKSVDTNLSVPNEKERKKPFLIGVAGGTCCGKVSCVKGENSFCTQMLCCFQLKNNSFL